MEWTQQGEPEGRQSLSSEAGTRLGTMGDGKRSREGVRVTRGRRRSRNCPLRASAGNSSLFCPAFSFTRQTGRHSHKDKTMEAQHLAWTHPETPSAVCGTSFLALYPPPHLCVSREMCFPSFFEHTEIRLCATLQLALLLRTSLCILCFCIVMFVSP